MSALANPPRQTALLLGEAPGAEEDQQGSAFVGPAGRLLDEALEAAGAREGELFITNTVKCRPPKNRTPRPAEVKACRIYLDGELRKLDPSFILALGRTAAKALGWAHSVAEGRRCVFFYNDIPCLVSWHPSFVLRNRMRMLDYVADLSQFLEIARSEGGYAGKLTWP